MKPAKEKLSLREALGSTRVAVAYACRAAPGSTTVLVLITLAAAGAPVAAAWLTRLVLDRLVGAGNAALLSLALGLAGIGLVSALLPSLTTYAGNQLGRQTSFHAVGRLYTVVNSFSGLARLESPPFQDRLRMAQSAGSQAIGGIVQSALRIAGGTLTSVGFVAALCVVSPAMTALVVACTAPVLAAQLRLSRHRALSDWRISSVRRRELFYQTLLSSLDAAKEIRLYAAGDHLRDRMLTERRTADTEHRAMDRRQLVTQGGLALLGALVGGVGLVWAALAARRGVLTVGDVSMFVASVAGVQAALAGLVKSLADLHHLLLMMRHYLAIVGSTSDSALPVDHDELPPLRRGIEFRDVWFRYAEDHPWVLRGANLFIPHGEAVALVGANGAGKSTLVKLLCRFYEPTRGAVLWDGVDIRRVPAQELRRRLGAVFQDYMHYDLSAAENIAIGDIQALGDRARLVAAAREAGIDRELSALPEGYDTMLSRIFTSHEEAGPGALLSGGQWQRLALARAFLRRDPDLLILDEPNSGLDAEAEHDVHLRLVRHRKGRTSLLISHRLGAIRDADRIVVLADGRITEEGGHEDLLARNGTYARLFTLQASGYQAADR
ncbi:ABC transporter ATP-binding protein [Streptomyces spinoverrucosus]|uniref:ABC transporter ATP-binding protein n=1 Tax=Streptomyces spinoverrucosus TaxID=284043 RepID=UPI0018C3F474|nr:ABC transporter ATP-binding protein [Streptomyces spinoverrucosus]MBG0857420.1 ABC transporter ATP-binding protein [Streptomyces spinoverrucosus]